VSTIQGNFLSPGVQDLVKDYLAEVASREMVRTPSAETPAIADPLVAEQPSYIDVERAESADADHDIPSDQGGRLVDVSRSLSRAAISALRLLFLWLIV
jgi:hypothetical protein